MQYITLSGRLGRDAKKQPSKNGDEFISLTLACDGRSRGESKTTWYDVILQTTKKHENMLQYLKKGSAVIVAGELDSSIYESQNGPAVRLSVFATYIEFNNNGGGNSTDKPTKEQKDDKTEDRKETKTSKKKTEEATPSDIPMTDSEADDDELPF